VLEVIQATERISGCKVPYVMSPRRAGDPVEVYADPAFAAHTLGWKAQFSLDDIISTAWQWHSTHIDGYTK
jgi:UDP-glucose 4-epimerase